MHKPTRVVRHLLAFAIVSLGLLLAARELSDLRQPSSSEVIPPQIEAQGQIDPIQEAVPYCFDCKALVNAVIRQESGYMDNRCTRANNPGCVMDSQGKLVTFDNPEQGWDYVRDLLCGADNRHGYLEMALKEDFDGLSKTYCGSGTECKSWAGNVKQFYYEGIDCL